MNSHVDTAEITHISLCAGYGGIDLGLRKVLPSLRTIAYSEVETFAIENLLARMEGGQLDPAPVWSDLRTFPWEEFSGLVDIISGGFPCQPFSSAGKRAGDEDERHLFPYILEGIRRCRPAVVLLENVEGILSAKLAGDNWRDPAGTPVLLHVFRELERVGYNPTAGIFSAAECGAPHQRKRVFILAHRNDTGSQGRKWSGEAGAQGASGRHVAKCGGQVWPSRPGEPQHDWEPPRVVGHSSSQRREQNAALRDQQQTGRAGEVSGKGGGESMGNAESGRRCGSGLPVRSRKSCEASVDVAGTGKSVGNAAGNGRQHDQQSDWEPPRVVGNAERIRRATTNGNDRGMANQECEEESSESKSWDTAQAVDSAGYRGEEPPRVVGNAERAERGKIIAGGDIFNRNDAGREEEADRTGTSSKLGNAEQQQHDGRTIRADELQSRQGGAWSCGQSFAQTDGESGQTQPALGGDTDGPASGLDDAIVYASDCQPCQCCGEPQCHQCGEHYADCPCAGPDSNND